MAIQTLVAPSTARVDLAAGDVMYITAGGVGTVTINEGETDESFRQLGPALGIGPFEAATVLRIYLVSRSIRYTTSAPTTPSGGGYDDTEIRALIETVNSTLLTGLASKADQGHAHDDRYLKVDERDSLKSLSQGDGKILDSQLPPSVEQRFNDIYSRLLSSPTGRPVYSASINFTGGTPGVIGSNHTLTFGTATNTPTLVGYTKKLTAADGTSTVGSEVVVPYSTTTVTIVPTSDEAGKSMSFSVRFFNAVGASDPVSSPAVSIASVATVSWTRTAVSAVVTAQSIQALACSPTGDEVYCVQRIITGGGGVGVTAANQVGTATSNPQASTTTPTLNVPTAAQGTLITATAPLLVLGVWVEDDAASDTGSVFTKPDSSWQMIDPIEINGPDGQRIYIGLREYAISASVPATIAATNTFAKKWNSACATFKDFNPGLLTPGNTLEFFKVTTSTTATGTTVTIAVTPDNPTAYDNDLAIWVATPDTVGASQISGFTQPAGHTKILDDHATGTAQSVPVCISTFVKTPAGSLGTISGSGALSSGTAVPLGAVLVIRGSQSGGGGQLAAAGSVCRWTWNGSAFSAQSTILTLSASDSWVTSLAATRLSSGPHLVWSGASPQDLGPGYTQGYTYNSTASHWRETQRFQGNFSSSTSAVSASAAANGAVSLNDDGTVLNAVFPSPTNVMLCYDGTDPGRLRLSPTLNAPGSRTLTSPKRGNAISTDSNGLTRATISNGQVVFETRTSKFGAWSPHSTFTPSGGAIADRVCLSRNGTQMMVRVGTTVEFWGGGIGNWSSQGTLTAAGGYSGFGDDMCIQDDGRGGYVTETNGTDVTPGSLASGYTQKQKRIVRVDRQ